MQTATEQLIAAGYKMTSVSWENQVANVYAVEVVKWTQAAIDNPNLAKLYTKKAKKAQVRVDLYRTMATESAAAL